MLNDATEANANAKAAEIIAYQHQRSDQQNNFQKQQFRRDDSVDHYRDHINHINQ
jgi:hypothetical protein